MLDSSVRKNGHCLYIRCKSAVRSRDWKLLEFFEDQHLELYNLRNDLGEKHDLAKEMPEKAKALRDQLHVWRTAVNAALPAPNPDFKPKAKR